MWIVYCSKEQL